MNNRCGTNSAGRLRTSRGAWSAVTNGARLRVRFWVEPVGSKPTWRTGKTAPPKPKAPSPLRSAGALHTLREIRSRTVLVRRFKVHSSPDLLLNAVAQALVLSLALMLNAVCAQTPASKPEAGGLPTLFLIGDSTVRNHTRGQLGWGDPIAAWFDPETTA